MTIPVSDIISSVRRILKQPDYPEADIIGYLNDSLSALPDRIRALRATTTIIGTGESRYPLPDDVYYLESVSRQNQTVSTPTTIDRINVTDLTSGQAQTGYYDYTHCVYGDDIWFVPPLSSGEQAYLFYRGTIPTVVDSAQELQAPETLRNPLINHIVAEIMTSYGNPLAPIYVTKYEKSVIEAEHSEIRRQNPGGGVPEYPPDV